MLIYICDDNEMYLTEIHNLVKEFFENKKTPNIEYKLFKSAEELLRYKDGYPDFAFLDVELGGELSGNYIGKILKEKNPNIKIFIVTSHVGYIDEAFRFSFFRFLTKPINKNNLFRNLNDALYQYNNELKEIVIETKTDIITLNTNNIICVKVDKRGSVIHTINGNISSTKSITSLEKTLEGSSFFRSHREFIVNLRYIVKFDKMSILLKYNDIEVDAYLSTRKYKDLKDKYLWYKERML
ncbi:MAG: LytTR family DNA-binding domain-containing protein [Clostridia bacterium]